MKINKKIKNISTLALSMLAIQTGNAADGYFSSEINKSVDLGLNIVNHKSFKFGEYTGMNESDVDGGFSLSSGLGEVRRWTFEGTDLGSTSRNLSGSIRNQGKWKVKVGYDELRHNISDSFQSPLQGTMGGNSFTLPLNFGAISGASSATATGGTRSLDATTQLSAFKTPEVYSSRKNTSLNSTYIINPNMNVVFDYNHLDQSGAKLLGTGAQGNITLNGGIKSKNEAVNIIMNPTKFKTDSFMLGLNWLSEKGHLTGDYYGSIFRNAYDSVTFQNSIAAAAAPTCASTGDGSGCFSNNKIGTAPNNNFHQLSLNGTYKFNTANQLVGGISYGRNTQDQAYTSTSVAQNYGMTAFENMITTPAASLDGLIINTHGDLRLTNTSVNNLTLTIGTKLNKRQDKTASKTYVFKDITSSSTSRTLINAPYSNSSWESEVAGDYKLTRDQKIRLGYERETIKRWCDGMASTAGCIASPKSNENKFSLNYKLKATDAIRVNAGYVYSNKQGEFNHTFESNIGAATTATGNVNAGDKLGFESKMFASRQENIFNLGSTWQVKENLDFAIKGRFIQDKYEAVLGVQQSKATSASLDSTYVYNDNHQVSFYTNWSSGQRDLKDGNNGTITTASTEIWGNRIKDDVNTVGIISQHGGLLDGKMEITSDLSYGMERTRWTTLMYYVTAPTCEVAKTCGQIEAKTKIASFKLTDSYKINKNSKITLGYVFEHLSNNDFFYNIYQYRYTPTAYMPTNEQAPAYTVNMVTAMYNYIF